MNRTLLSLSIAGSLLLPYASQAKDAVDSAEMWRIIQKQQKEIDALQRQLKSTDDKAEAAVVAVENSAGNSGNWADRTHLGGYGEIHYNNLDGDGGASDKNEIDLHRFVLFLGHDFNDDIRFFSELEVEHGIAGDSQVGEVEIEQAFVEMDINDTTRARAGVFLLPVGILNETHEPNTFYGVERNPVEKDIIPSTWWAAGTGITGEIGSGWQYDLAIHEGLKTSASSNYKPRSGRQKSGKATAEDFAYSARLKWTGIPGVELAGSFQHQSDITQGTDSSAGSANLYELHGIYNKGAFGLRALYALWELDGNGPASIGADEQSGWYLEPSYKLNEKLGVFARYNAWDNQAGGSSQSEKTQWDAGLNWWPHPDVVIKADYQKQDHDNGQNQDGFNLGVGFQF